eukprot:2829026-Karenia_brevis.AAC.1
MAGGCAMPSPASSPSASCAKLPSSTSLARMRGGSSRPADDAPRAPHQGVMTTVSELGSSMAVVWDASASVSGP